MLISLHCLWSMSCLEKEKRHYWQQVQRRSWRDEELSRSIIFTKFGSFFQEKLFNYCCFKSNAQTRCLLLESKCISCTACKVLRLASIHGVCDHWGANVPRPAARHVNALFLRDDSLSSGTEYWDKYNPWVCGCVVLGKRCVHVSE